MSKSMEVPAKKSDILKAARAIFMKYGYNKTTLDDIAASMGMKKSSLYYYFKGKEDIFENVVARELNHYLKDAKEKTGRIEDVEEKILKFFKVRHLYLHDAINKYSLNINVALEFQKVIHEKYKDFVNKDKDLLASLIQAGVQRGLYLTEDPEFVAGIMLEAAEALEVKELTYYNDLKNSEETSGNASEKIEIIIKLILKGLKFNERT